MTVEKPRQTPDRPPYVFVERTRCPRCSSTNVGTQRTIERTEEAISRRMKCQVCGCSFVLVLE